MNGFCSVKVRQSKGCAILACLSNYELWAEDAQAKSFMLAIHVYFLQHPVPHHCNLQPALVLPGTDSRLPERVICSECGRSRERWHGSKIIILNPMAYCEIDFQSLNVPPCDKCLTQLRREMQKKYTSRQLFPS
ncbi:hypothetical protein DITRI_Ditri09bG0018100 [Diplodiscus trichospermus]